MIDYDRTPRHLETWTKDDGEQREEEQRENLIKPEKSDDYISGVRFILVIISISVVYFLNMLDTTVLATAIPYITDEFHSLLDIGWYGSAYTLATAILQPMTGKFYFRFRNKWVFGWCIVIFEVGSIVCATASSSSILIAGRVISGLGGAGLLNGCLIILSSCAPPHRTPALIGIVMGIGQMGLAFGPLIGGAFTEYASWRWCFYINLIIGIPVAAIIFIMPIPDQMQKPAFRDAFNNGIKVFDIPGFLIFTCAIVMFFLALQFGGNRLAWDSAAIICLFWASGFAGIAWLVWDWYARDDAMVPYSMMSQRVVWVSCLCMAFQAMPMYSLTVYLPIYFQAVLGRSAFASGYIFLGTIVPQLLFAVVAGRAIERTGFYTPFLLTGVVLTSVGLGLMSLLMPDSEACMWVGFQIIYGIGRGISLSTPFVAVQNSLPKKLIPAAMSMLMFAGNFSGAVAVVLCQTVFTNSLSELITQYAPGIDAQLVIDAGSTKVREVVSPDQLPEVMDAYAKSIARIWDLDAAIAALAFVFGWLLGFKDIRKK
ncbi:putative MFS multidrug transporter [Diaporthe sp. PMI_573]|nr:putative MFS multidrug transporter [Diaporthaceae sp. PMI_573]